MGIWGKQIDAPQCGSINGNVVSAFHLFHSIAFHIEDTLPGTPYPEIRAEILNW